MIDFNNPYFPLSPGSGGQSVLQNKELTVTSNGDRVVLPDTGYDGMSLLSLHTQVPANVETKTVTVSENGTQTITPSTGKDGISSLELTVNVGGESDDDALYLYDYDGTLVQSYDYDDAMALTELPATPDHTLGTDTDGVPLTSDGWNWTLAEIQTYLTDAPEATVIVGACYHPTDGNTHVIFDVADYQSPQVYISGNSALVIDWGDGGEATAPGFHTYSTGGVYHAVVQHHATASYNNLTFGTTQTGSSYINIIKASKYVRNIYLSEYSRAIAPNCYRLETLTLPQNYNLTYLDNNEFYGCNIKAIIIPNGNVTTIYSYAFGSNYQANVLSISNKITSIKDYSFNYLYGVKYICIPKSVTTIGLSSSYGNAFSYNTSLEKVSIANNVSVIGGSPFSNCVKLNRVAFGISMTSTPNNLFQACNNISSVTLPSSLITMGSTFYDTWGIEEIEIPDGVTTLCLNRMHSLKEVEIPDGVTTLANGCFETCYALESVTIPSLVTTIPQYCFQNCHSLESLTIPEGVTTIQGYGSLGVNSPKIKEITLPSTVTTMNDRYIFRSDTCIRKLIMMATTPPTLADYALSDGYLNAIYVPYSADHSILNAYKSATNWSRSADIIFESPEETA